MTTVNQAIKDYLTPEKKFRVSFELRRGGMLKGDYFPEDYEKPFETEEEAWRKAEIFAEAMKGEAVNVYVVDAKTFVPVKDFRDRELNVYPEEKMGGGK
jgi:hypothetical protein